MLTHARSSLALAVSFALLAACGGNSTPTPPVSSGPPSPPPTGLAGSVAVGVAIMEGKLRVLDATGSVVAQDITVGVDGSYSIPTLTGTAPWRIEACGYAGANYECIYSVAQATGTANVTPLTTAAVLLAANLQPGALMTGAATGLSAAALDNAQTQLRTGLAPIMSGNVASDFNFITGSLTAGSRSAYDRVLDSVGVSSGEDGGTFVQITPRLGTGNLYLEPGVTSGTVAADAQAEALPLAQIDALFARMTTKLVNEAACLGPNGLAAEVASNARFEGEEGLVTGAEPVAAEMCGFFAEAEIWGAAFLNPTLGRCVTTGGESRCHVGFDLRTTDGAVLPVGNGMGVVLAGNTWKFLGAADPVNVHIDARVQRQTRIDNLAVAPTYMRALSIDITRVAGLECAKVAQSVTGGTPHVFAILKAYDGDARRLSVWRANAFGTEESLDVNAGFLRNSDDSWYTLPDGAPGDEVVRNFFRNGRDVVVSLFSDAACTIPLVVEGVSTIAVEIEGVPPVFAAMPTFPWPELTPATVTAIAGATLGANSTGSLTAAWTYPNGRSGVSGVTFCGSLADCGDENPGRFGERDISPATPSVTLPLQSSSLALGVSRTLSLHGTGPDGIAMQSNFTDCSGAPGHCD